MLVEVKAQELKRVARGGRCGVRMERESAAKQALWNAVYKEGIVVDFLCPDCQTDAESVQATIKEATLDYNVPPIKDGRGRVRPKLGEP